MSYKEENIKNGIKLHTIETNKFKTNLFAVFLSLPIKREEVTLNTIIPAVLKQGSMKYKTMEEINKQLENMYGAVLDCGIEKTGDNHVIKFYIESLNDNYIPKGEKITKKALDIMLEIILNPIIKNGSFVKEYVDIEKNNIERLINSKIDNKDSYALNRCIEEMYKGKPYGLYKFGYVEDLNNIDEKNLYQYYKKLISQAKIDIFGSGDIKSEQIIKIVKENEYIKNLPEREDKHIINNETTEIKEQVKENKITESMEVTQGKLVIGLDVQAYEKNSKYAIALYNVILGESATSKLFQNVREKASLAYSARSNYSRQKNNIYIRCGIEIDKYEQALEIIMQQLEDMKNGNFTDEDIQNAKKYMISGVKTVQDEQDSEITYYIGQELSGQLTTFEEYIKNIEDINKEQIEKIAKTIKTNTIYFLKD